MENTTRQSFIRRPWSRIWPWLVILGPAGLCALMGFLGFVEYFRCSGETPSRLDVFYLTLQLFTLESGAVDGPVPWQLQVARFLAPVAAFWSVFSGLAALFRGGLVRFQLRFIRRHNVVCGLGRTGLQLVSDFRRDGQRVVVIEADEQNDNIEVARELGAIVLTGDASQEFLLKRARAVHARSVVALCGKDGVNVEVAVRCHQLARRYGGDLSSRIQCYIQVFELQLIELLRENRIFTESNDPFDAHIVNSFRNAARLAFQRQPLDRVRIKPQDDTRAHLIVVGFGRMGQSLALQAARTAHYANDKQLRITAIDLEAPLRKRDLFALYPAFEEVCETTFITADGRNPQTHADIDKLCGEPNSIVTVAVCVDDDSRSLAIASGIAARLKDRGVPVLVRLSEETGLAVLLGDDTCYSGRLGQLCPFGQTSRVATREVLLSEKLDETARAIHEAYRELRRQGGRSAGNPSSAPWEELRSDFRESNRQQTDHMSAKLRAAGCSVEPIEPRASVTRQPFAFTDEEIELLAKMEHSRWCAERLLAGWKRADKDDKPRKISSSLKPWDELTEEVKDYDRETVRIIPKLLKMSDARISRE